MHASWLVVVSWLTSSHPLHTILYFFTAPHQCHWIYKEIFQKQFYIRLSLKKCIILVVFSYTCEFVVSWEIVVNLIWKLEVNSLLFIECNCIIFWGHSSLCTVGSFWTFELCPWNHYLWLGNLIHKLFVRPANRIPVLLLYFIHHFQL